MAEIQTYIYPTTHRVSFGLYHNPSTPSTIKIPKSMGTELQFIVVNADGRNVVLDPNTNETLTLHISDTISKKIIYTSILQKVLPTDLSEAGMTRPTINKTSKIYYSCIIPPIAFDQYTPGKNYRWSITFNSTTSSQALFVNEYGGVDGNVELFETVLSASTPTTNLNIASFREVYHPELDKLALGYVGNYKIYGSDVIKTRTQLGASGELSTILMEFANFSGRIQLQGCLNNDVPLDTEAYKWFPININGVAYIEPMLDIPLDGTLVANIVNDNFMWVRFLVLQPQEQYAPTVSPSSTIKKISIRI